MADLADKLAIRELTARYNHAADCGDAERWAATFVEDGTFCSVGGETGTGRQALVEHYRRLGPFKVRYMTTDAVIEVDGDIAKQVCYPLVVDDGNGNRFITGVYTDVRRTPDGWRFVSRTIAIDQRRRDLSPS